MGSRFVSLSLVEALPLRDETAVSTNVGTAFEAGAVARPVASPRALYVKLDDFGPRATDELAAALRKANQTTVEVVSTVAVGALVLWLCAVIGRRVRERAR